MPNLKEPKILVLTDNQLTLNFLSPALSPRFLMIVESGNEGPALHASADTSIDLIIVDLLSQQTGDQAFLADSILSLREQPLLFFVDIVTDELNTRLAGIRHLGFVESSASPAYLRSLLDRIISRWEERRSVREKLNQMFLPIHSESDSIPLPPVLQESERRLTTLVGNLQGVVYRCLFDSMWTMKYLSDHVYELTGYAKEELLNNSKVSFYGLILPEDEVKIRPIIEQAVKMNKGYTLEYRIRRKDGEVRWVWEKGCLSMDVVEKTVYLEGYITDITERIQKEQALKQSEELFETAFNTTPVSITLSDQFGRLVAVNPGFVEMTGYQPEDVIGRLSEELSLLDADVRNRLIEDLNHDPDSLNNKEAEITAKDGRVLQIVFSIRRVMLNNQRHNLVFMRDLTPMRTALDTLKNSEMKFRNLYETMKQGVVYQDTQGNILSANPAASRILGLTMDELTGRSSMNPEWKSIHEDGSDFPGETHPAMIALKTGTVQEGEIIGIYHPIHKEYRWIKITAIPQFAEDSKKPSGVYAIFEDITELRETEMRLRNQELVFQAMLKHSPVYVFFKDHDIRSIYLSENYVNMLGFPAHEAIGKTMYDLFPSEFAKKIIEDDKAILANQKPVELEEEFRGKYYSTIKYPIIRPKEPPLLAGFTIDITDRKKLELELRQAHKKAEQLSGLKSNFLLLISHELRTPMTGILGYSKFIAELAKDSALTKYADLLYHSGERLRATVDLLLDYSVIESGAIDIALQPTDVLPLVQQVCDSLEADFRNKSLLLTRVFNVSELMLNIDNRLMKDCIYHILNNALKYTESGAVTVEVGTEVDAVSMNGIIRVTDTGIGIKKENIDLIWDSFRQISEGRGRHFDGMGLGLSVAKEYMKKMNGEISVISTPGIGSVFTISVPMLSVPASAVPLQPVQNEPLISPENMNQVDFPRILHIENDPLAVSLVQIAIGKYAIIDVAVDGAEALYKAQCGAYDLILTDINLGSGADGAVVTKQIRKIPHYEEIPIVAVTAYSRIGDREEFLSAGCSHYLSKPFTRSELLSLFQSILSVNPRFQSLFS